MPFRWTVTALFALLAQGQDFIQADVEAGGRIYRSHCAECHGLQGEGGRGPNLQRGEYFHGSSNEALFRTINRGIPGTEMPGVYFEGKQVWQLVAFVRSLARTGQREPVPGDPRRGEQLYARLGCAACHSIGATGGRTAPELTWIGSSRPPSHLRQSILDPSAEIAERWRQVEVTSADGKVDRGFALDEDSYSIRMLDEAANLRSFARTGLKKVHVEKKESAMPSYRGRVSDSELDDLVAYLSSLRRKVEER
jgi:putative heme-binding domain-containing protein